MSTKRWSTTGQVRSGPFCPDVPCVLVENACMSDELVNYQLYFATIKCWWITKVPWSIIEEGVQNQRFNSITQIPHYMYFHQM